MRRFVVFFVLGLLAVMLVACGGDSGPEAVSLSFTGDDSFRFDPMSATVPAGAEVTVTFENAGALEHNWVLIPGDADPTQATEADAINGADAGVVTGGESATFTFTAPEAGTYQYVCTVPGHAAAGMVGRLTVTEN